MCGRRSRSKSVDRSLAAPQAKSGHEERYTANGTCQVEVMTRCIGPPPPHVREQIETLGNVGEDNDDQEHCTNELQSRAQCSLADDAHNRGSCEKRGHPANEDQVWFQRSVSRWMAATTGAGTPSARVLSVHTGLGHL